MARARHVVLCAMLGLALVAFGIASILILNTVMHKEVYKKVLIQNNTDSELFPIWADPSLLPDLYLQIYPFNVTNPQEVVKGEKAILKQMGPYTYREFRKKENIVFNDNGTVSYIERKWYEFDPELSVGSDNDTFTTLNIPLVVLANALRYDSGFLQSIVSKLLKLFSEGLFVTKTVRQIVFGYEDPMLAWGKTLFPSQFSTDMVGILAGKNNSYDGVYTVFTGEDDINKLGVIDKFNGSSSLHVWSTKYANMINGSVDGSVFPPFVSRDFKANIFSMDLCRSAVAMYHGEEHVTDYNIKVFSFRAPKEELEKPSLNPDNAGFCTPYGNCMGSGVLNISTCQEIDGFQVPVVISFPHFYMAEKQYVDGVIGMHPSSEYTTEVKLEPTTGLVMQAFKRIQMNMYLQRSAAITDLEKVNDTVFPILWVNESVKIDNKHAARIKHELLIPLLAFTIGRYVVIGIGILLILFATFLAVRRGVQQTNKRTEVRSVRLVEDADEQSGEGADSKSSPVSSESPVQPNDMEGPSEASPLMEAPDNNPDSAESAHSGGDKPDPSLVPDKDTVDSPDPVAPVESPDLVHPVDSPDHVAPVESPDLVHPVDSPDHVAPVESPDLVHPVDSPDVVAPVENPALQSQQKAQIL